MAKLRAYLPFLAFTALFAALAGFVFWGTWSPDVAPIMPDCAVTHTSHWIADWVRGFCANGKFVPDDLKVFLGSPYWWQELQFVFAAYCAALATAWFCRGRGLSPLASYAGGLLLAFSGYWLTLFSAGHLGWFRWMTYGVFAFGLIDRAVGPAGRLRHWLLLGACVAWGSFYQPDLWLLFTLLTGAYFIFRCVRERRLNWKGTLVAAAAFFVIGMPSFATAFGSDLKGRDEQISRGDTLADKSASEKEKRWIFATNWSLPPAETLEFICPRLNGDTSCPFTLSIGRRTGSGVRPYVGALGRPKDAPSGNYRQHSLYVGWLTVLLALVGAVAGLLRFREERGKTVAFFLVAAVLCWLFSMGRYCEIVYRLVYALPFGDYLRGPVKWHHLTEFALAVLAAHGIEAILVRWRERQWVRGVLVAALALALFDLARVDRLYCAPVDYTEARRTGSSAQLTFLPKQQFADPQVQAMVQQKRILSVATYPGRDDVYLVQILTPPEKRTDEPLPRPPFWGILSVLATFGVLGFCATDRLRRRNRT